MRIRFLLCLLATCRLISAQNYPQFGPEIKVAINGLAFDAMEPFISADGSILFFNSLNSGGNTNLYYAGKVNDSTFSYVGLVGGCYDPSPNHLDAVASMDSAGSFFWVSLRGYPAVFENLHRGVYASGTVSAISRVYGNFYIAVPGWIVMDAAVSCQGNELYYCNAYIDFVNNGCNGIPCEGRLGMALKINDSTFSKAANSDGIFALINDTNYVNYAPQVTRDGLELYYTRYMKNTFNTEICVAVRSNAADTFSVPLVLYSNPGFAPEAASPTYDKQKIYYHQKEGGVYKIFLRYRTGTSSVEEHNKNELKLLPNPADGFVTIAPPDERLEFTTEVFNARGELCARSINEKRIDLSAFRAGIYFVRLIQKEKVFLAKLVKR